MKRIAFIVVDNQLTRFYDDDVDDGGGGNDVSGGGVDNVGVFCSCCPQTESSRPLWTQQVCVFYFCAPCISFSFYTVTLRIAEMFPLSLFIKQLLTVIDRPVDGRC